MLKSNLLRGIVVISLCSVLFLPVYTFYYLYPAFEGIITERTEEEAERFASHMAHLFFPSNEDMTKDSITPLFRQGVDKMAKDMQLVKVKVFSPAGEIIYSTASRETGAINSRKYFRDVVAKGRPYTQVVRKSAHSLEGQFMTRDVIETYAPLMKGDHFIGAFELYYDITKSRDSFNALVSRSSFIVFGVALGLLVGVIISALNAHRSIRERDAAEDELRRHRDHLEQLVETRTREIMQVHQQIEKEMMEKQQMESSLLHTEARYRSLVESTQDSIYLIDADHRYLFMNQMHARRMGLRPDQFLGHPYSEFHTPEETLTFVENVDRVFRTGESLQHEHRSKRDDRYFLQTLSPAKDQSGKVIAVTVVSKDITVRKHMEEELRALSLTDQLTGLYNRRGFLTLMDQYFKIANRLKNKLSILYADLDNLKGINDTFGHQEGDRVLTEAADVLRDTFRESDVVARIGGDEFVVMPAVMGNATLESVAERLDRNIAAVNALPGRKHRLSISYGIAFYDPEHPCTAEDLLDQGDRLMYEHKKRKTAGSRDRS
ncbi:MAG: diguanylate cyclase [Nitrospirae bacterium]|nr:diguanylate cyclase [Nitrospirota bacterium]